MFAKLIKISGTAALAGLCLVSAQAGARTAAQPTLVHVTTTGLDLSTAEGRSAADTRIREAAREVCKSHAAISAVRGEECYNTATKAGQRQLDVVLAQRATTNELAAR